MILSVKVNLSSDGACKVNSGARGREPNNSLDRELNNSLPLPTPLHHTVLDTLLTHSTLKPTHYTHLNN